MTDYPVEQLREIVAAIPATLSAAEFLAEFEQRLRELDADQSKSDFVSPETREEWLINLFDGVYAVRFLYALVTERTMYLSLPSSFRRALGENGLAVQFAVEDSGRPRTKRADAEEMAKAFPAEVALLSAQVENLADYVLFKTVSN
ncbi:MAG TPA: hypothetical protein PKC13_29700 [Blastocatellia bacterium]|nr:hypothetical protein [Blastocatellia bacterium]HMX29797.1 hypothetical protein [Blastocatellia bacterium]HMY71181.1 hypothetical protein [Blastocatellia bacterium]